MRLARYFATRRFNLIDTLAISLLVSSNSNTLVRNVFVFVALIVISSWLESLCE